MFYFCRRQGMTCVARQVRLLGVERQENVTLSPFASGANEHHSLSMTCKTNSAPISK